MMVRGSSFASFPRRAANAFKTATTAGSPSDRRQIFPRSPTSRNQHAMSLTIARSAAAPFPRAAPP
eukprot:11757811-Heterocapsa_arctica.AAC.1